MKLKGEFFGEICLLGRPHRRLSAMAKEHCILLELNQAAFDCVMKDYLRQEQS